MSPDDKTHKLAKTSARGRPPKQPAVMVDPELRELLDLIAEELAAEYLRLTRGGDNATKNEEV